MLVLCSAPALGAQSRHEEDPPELVQAREGLKISQATSDRIAGELEALRSSGKATPEVLAAYETYLARVQDMVAENEKVVAQMESAFAAHRSQPPRGAVSSKDADNFSATAQEEGSVDPVQALDRKLDESLAAFDEMLLKELRLIQASSAKRMQGLAEAAAAAAKEAGGTAGGSWSEGAPAGSDTAQKGPEPAGAPKDGQEPGSGQASQGRGRPGEAPGSQDQGGGWGSGGSGAPPSGYTSSADDDIVARQLREAAEKETDPVLKAKLWKEYEEYKKSRAKP